MTGVFSHLLAEKTGQAHLKTGLGIAETSISCPKAWWSHVLRSMVCELA
jgi:hypothetical protein